MKLNQPTKLLMQVMHVIKFNIYYFSYIIFYLIDLYDNKVYVIFLIKGFFKRKKS
jgi:hypothetical protein